MIPGPADPHEAPGLYIHIPFCASLCPYCDFSVLMGGPERQRPYVDHLLQEIRRTSKKDELASLPAFDTIYFGEAAPRIWLPRRSTEFSSRQMSTLGSPTTSGSSWKPTPKTSPKDD